MNPWRRLASCVSALLLAHAAPGIAADQQTTCVEAKVGTERAYGCVSDALSQLARMAHTKLEMNTLDAQSAAPALGTFDRTATAERMGNTFGHSIYAQRPGTANFYNPLLPKSPR